MSNDTLAVVENIYAAWQARNLSQVLQLLADDMVFALHIPREVLAIGGETIGKPAVKAALQGLLDTYDFLAYEPGPIAVDGPKANGEVRFRYRQKTTGEIIDSRMRHQWLVETGQAKRLDEWHDVAVVTAFLDRVAARIASAPR